MGAVTLSTTVSPVVTSGPSGSVSPASVTLRSGGSGSSVLTISTVGTTPTGTYTVTVTGTSGPLIRSVAISVYISCGCGGGGGSIAQGSLITMADGSLMAVQTLHVGDKMLGYDPTTGNFTVATVTSIKAVMTYNMLIIRTASGTPFRVDANPRQTLWTMRASDGTLQWLPVTQVQSGDHLLTPGGWVTVTGIEFAPAGQHTMFDITASMPYFAYGYLDPIYKM